MKILQNEHIIALRDLENKYFYYILCLTGTIIAYAFHNIIIIIILNGYRTLVNIVSYS